MRWLYLVLSIAVTVFGNVFVSTFCGSTGVWQAAFRLLPFTALSALFIWIADLPLFLLATIAVPQYLLLCFEYGKCVIPALVVLVLPLALVFGGLALWESRTENLLQHGTSASAKVLEVRDLSTSVGPDPMIELRLQVLPSDGMPYETETKMVVSRLAMAYYRPGITVNVKCDPEKPKRVVVESIQAGALP